MTDRGKWGALHPNGSSTGAMSAIINRQADFGIGKFGLTLLRNKFMSPSISYVSFPMVVIVPQGEPYTSLEKLTKPFREVIWALVLVVLLGGFATIAVIRLRFTVKVQNFVLGPNNASPYLNAVNVFLGGSLDRLPRRNFARTLLCIFMLYCLVVRNAYTGALFKFIHANHLQRPIIASIDELEARDFPFYLVSTGVEHIVKMPQIYERSKLISREEVTDVIKSLSTDPYFKGGLISSSDSVIFYNMNHRRSNRLEVCPEVLMTLQFTIYFQKNSFLVKRFDSEILYFSANGMINMLFDKNLQKKLKRPSTAQHRPRPLHLDQVMGSFWLLIFGVSLASIVALGEFCYGNFLR